MLAHLKRSTHAALLVITCLGSTASLMNRCHFFIIVLFVLVILSIIVYTKYIQMCTIIAQVIPILLHMDPDSLLNCGRSYQPPPPKKKKEKERRFLLLC